MKKTSREEKAKYWKAQIESLIKYEKGSNQSQILRDLVREYDWKPSRSSFSTRLSRGSLTLVELSEILELCEKKIFKTLRVIYLYSINFLYLYSVLISKRLIFKYG